MKHVAMLLLAALSFGMARKPPEKSADADASRRPAMDVSHLIIPNARWQGLQCRVTKPGHQVIRDQKSWEALWQRAFETEAPPVDFSKRIAVAVFAGVRHTGGYAVEWLEPQADGDDVVVRYRIRSPGTGSFVIQAFTQPYSIQLFKAAAGDLRVVEEN